MLGWTHSNFDEVDEANNLKVKSAIPADSTSHPKTQLEKCLGEDMAVVPSAAVFLRQAFDAVDGFDEQISGYQDDDFCLRLLAAGYRNGYVRHALTRRRVAADNGAQNSESRMLYARKLAAAFPDEPRHGRFYTSDFIIPRFLAETVAQLRVALRSHDQAIIDALVSDITSLKRLVSPQRPLRITRDAVLISAIIPLYNGAAFIRQALQSVIDQTLPPDEVIVVDDGSDDAGPDIVADMARTHPIRLIRKVNGGQSSARNAAVDHSHGDLIALLDQDDVWYPDHLSGLLEPFLEDSRNELGWSYSDLDEINEAGEMVARRIIGNSDFTHPKESLTTCLKEDMFILPSASLVSRQAFLSVGGFDERLSGYEDDDLFLRLFQAGFEHVFLPQALSRWRIYQSSSSYSPRMAVSRTLYARTLIERFPDKPEIPRYYVRDLVAPRFFRSMAAGWRRAVLKGTIEDRKSAHDSLVFISKYLRRRSSLALRFLVLPALRIPSVARFVIAHRELFLGVSRRLF
jgi:glycosyltransferase involved in cell wall biosynthesis